MILVFENTELIKARFLSIHEPKQFIETPEGLTTLDAIAMRLQYIGECIKRIDKIDPAFFTQHTEIDWPKIINLRDFISHHYEMLNHEIVFNICEIYIPQLNLFTQKILSS
jgi:uncharacterized protein with HEPN domain